MSTGSPIVHVRVPPLLLVMMNSAMEKANKTRKRAPYTRSSWILDCVVDRLDKLERGRKKRKVKEKQVDEELAA